MAVQLSDILKETSTRWGVTLPPFNPVVRVDNVQQPVYGKATPPQRQRES